MSPTSQGPSGVRALPAHPNLEHLKNEAKQRLRALRNADAAAKLAEAQFQIAREYGFASWRQIKAHVEPNALGMFDGLRLNDDTAKSKLILTTSFSGSGHLKVARIAERVIPLTHRLVWGAVPEVANGADFFAARRRIASVTGEDWPYWQEWVDDEGGESDISSPRSRLWIELVDLCDTFESVELWIDPTPDAQLIMVQLLDRFSHHPGLIGKLALIHPDTPLGEWMPDGAAQLMPRHPVVEDHLRLATAAWRAFTRSTPEAWFQLLQQDIAAFPHFRSTVLEMLQELPDSETALSATEAMMLALIKPGGVSPLDVFPGYMKKNTRRVLDYWETARTLDRLARCSEPAVLGLSEGPFTLQMNRDKGRFRRYRQSRLRLSGLGERLTERRDDISRHNSINRWWGGVKLTNDNLWRWDATCDRLVAPA